MINRTGLTSMDGVPENVILMDPEQPMSEVFRTNKKCKRSHGDPLAPRILSTRADAGKTPWKSPAYLKYFNVFSFKNVWTIL